MVTAGGILTRAGTGPKTLAMARRALAAVVALAAAAGACQRASDAAPPCGAVAARFMYLAEQDLSRSGVDEASRRAVLAQLPAMRDSLATACADTQWSERVRRCLHAAGDHVGFETCQQELTEVQRRALDHMAASSQPAGSDPAARGETDPH